MWSKRQSRLLLVAQFIKEPSRNVGPEIIRRNVLGVNQETLMSLHVKLTLLWLIKLRLLQLKVDEPRPPDCMISWNGYAPGLLMCLSHVNARSYRLQL